jgi:hypothetical protein
VICGLVPRPTCCAAPSRWLPTSLQQNRVRRGASPGSGTFRTSHIRVAEPCTSVD